MFVSYWHDTDPRLKNVTFQGVLDDKKFDLTVAPYVTDVMIGQNWSFKKPLVAKMTGSEDRVMGGTVMEKYWYSNLPEPVVILEWTIGLNHVLKIEFIISPKEKRRIYGNLLDNYSKFWTDSENGGNDEISGCVTDWRK